MRIGRVMDQFRQQMQQPASPFEMQPQVQTRPMQVVSKPRPSKLQRLQIRQTPTMGWRQAFDPYQQDEINALMPSRLNMLARWRRF